MLGQRQRNKGYVNYVMQWVDEDMLQYYQSGNLFSIIGGKVFRAWV